VRESGLSLTNHFTVSETITQIQHNQLNPNLFMTTQEKGIMVWDVRSPYKSIVNIYFNRPIKAVNWLVKGDQEIALIDNDNSLRVFNVFHALAESSLLNFKGSLLEKNAYSFSGLTRDVDEFAMNWQENFLGCFKLGNKLSILQMKL
jgi:hypothetical protein